MNDWLERGRLVRSGGLAALTVGLIAIAILATRPGVVRCQAGLDLLKEPQGWREWPREDAGEDGRPETLFGLSLLALLESIRSGFI